MPAAQAALPRKPLPAPRFVERMLGPRIAQKIFWGYVLPFAFVLTFGIVLPIFLWFYLGRSVRLLDDLSWMSEHAASLKRTANDTEAHAYSFVRYHDRTFEPEFVEARVTFRSHYRELAEYSSQLEDPTISDAVIAVNASFETWLNLAVRVPLATAQDTHQEPLPPSVMDSQLRGIQEQFAPVDKHIDHLINLLDTERNRQAIRAHAAELLRNVTSVFIPLIALTLSLLFGRLSALGITRPLDTLTRATRELEEGGGSLRILLEDFGQTAANDEIGDLQRAFHQMARTISQREAVLHAQNEAVGALNRRIESVLNATNDGILMLDRAGGFSVVNQRLADLFGLPVDALQNRMFGEAGQVLLARFRNRAAVKRRFQELFDDPEEIADELYDLIDPSGRTVRIYSAPVRGYDTFGALSPGEKKRAAGPELLGRIFVFRDVTRETMLDRMKTEFVSTVSHELRTPLTAIKGYIDLMVGGQTGPLNDVQTEFLTLVQSSTRRLTDLINDMLDISRIESGRTEVRQVSVDYLPLVRETIKMLQPQAQTKEISLALTFSQGRKNIPANAEADLPRVRGDADRITQILTNFLSNGVKYTPHGGHVAVNVEFEQDFVTTCVADDGIGISGEDQHKLFQRFFRADNSTTRQTGGTGLGLAITKAILERLNGSVWVESEPGKGSRFYFTLPCNDGEDETEKIVSTPKKSTESTDFTEIQRTENGTAPASPVVSALILPITADLPTLHRLGQELRRQGFFTSGAGSVAEAVRRVRDLRPDLVLLDPLTPGMDGRDILRDLGRLGGKSLDGASLPPILIAAPRTENEKLASFGDDVALLPLQGVSCDGLPAPLADALRRRLDGKSGPGTVLTVGRDGVDYLETALKAIGGDASALTVARTPGELENVLREDSPMRRAPDVVLVGTDADARFDLGTWRARLRQKYPGTRTDFILLIENAIFEALDLRMLAPLGTNAVSIDNLGATLRRNLSQSATETSADATAAPEKQLAGPVGE